MAFRSVAGDGSWSIEGVPGGPLHGDAAGFLDAGTANMAGASGARVRRWRAGEDRGRTRTRRRGRSRQGRNDTPGDRVRRSGPSVFACQEDVFPSGVAGRLSGIPMPVRLRHRTARPGWSVFQWMMAAASRFGPAFRKCRAPDVRSRISPWRPVRRAPFRAWCASPPVQAGTGAGGGHRRHRHREPGPDGGAHGGDGRFPGHPRFGGRIMGANLRHGRVWRPRPRGRRGGLRNVRHDGRDPRAAAVRRDFPVHGGAGGATLDN